MKGNKRNILAICGSTKENSTNKTILETIKKRYSNLIELTIYNQIDKLPHFNPDLDNESNLPIVIQNFRNEIESADGILFCSPEYVFSLPGVLKNAIEWSVSTTIFSQKPTAYIIAAASGEKAFESLGLILKTIECKINKNSSLLIQGAKGIITKNGEISDEKTLFDIDTLIKSFLEIN